MPGLISRLTAPLLAAGLFFVPAVEALAQSAVLQGGPYTQNHLPQYAGQGNGQAVIKDGGGAGGGAIGTNPGEIGVTALGTGTAPFAGQGKGPYGANICDYDGPTNSSAGFHYLCLSANAQGGGLLAYGAGGSAAQLPLQFIVNGQTYTFPFSGSSAPTTTVVDTPALQALPVAPLASGVVITVGTYNLSTGQDSPPVGYYLTQTPCTVDAGSCFLAATAGYYWHITPQTVWDPRWWGAYGDVGRMINQVATTTSGSPAVTISTAGFTSADVGKLITITQFIDTTVGNGPSYQGRITVVNSATSITVSPNVGFNNSLGQIITYGHDDSVAVNNMATYLATLRAAPFPPIAIAASAIVQANFGGLVYGFCAAPLNWFVDGEITNGRVTALCSANMPIATTGVFTINGNNSGPANAGSRTGSSYFIADAGWLPVNAIFANVNATTHWHDIGAVNWLGSDAGTALFATGTSGTFQVTVADASAITQGMVSRGNTTACTAGGIPDRAVVVAVAANVITVNKLLTGTCSSATIRLYHDASGFVEPLGAGIHASDVIINQSEYAPFQTPAANHYGFGLFFDGNQANMRHMVDGGGVANVFLGPDAQGLLIDNGTQLFAQTYAGAEPNSASLISSDAAGLLELDHVGISGVMQVWHVTTAKQFPNIQASHIGASFNGGISDNFTPSNWLQLYTFVANTPTSTIQVTADWAIGTSQTGATTTYPVAFITAGSGSWTGISAAQAAIINTTFNYQTSGGQSATGPFATAGINLLTSPIEMAEFPTKTLTTTGAAGYSFLETDSPDTIIYTGSGTATWTIPSSIGPAISQTWRVNLINRTANTLTLLAGSGATLCTGGTCTAAGSTTLTQNTLYSLECPINGTGTAAVCFIK